MHIPKRYGSSRIDNCPFCGKVSTTKNEQGIPVCQAHKKQKLDGVKCACGEWLELLEGKWGPYFRCPNCGNISFKKGIEMIDMQKYRKNQTTAHRKQEMGKNENNDKERISRSQPQKKEVTVTSDELDFLY